MSIPNLEMSTDREYLDPAYGEKKNSTLGRRRRAKRESTRTPSTDIYRIQRRHPPAPSSHHQSPAGAHGDGEIDQRSEQHNSMLQLESMSVSGSSSVALSKTDPSNPFPVQPVPTYAGVLSAPKAITFTPNDVRSLQRLTGRADVDVAEVLSQFRLVVGFRVKAVAAHDEKFADNLAFEHLSLICDGPCLTLYQTLMSVKIDWCANVVNARNMSDSGSFAPPSTWEELK